MKLNDVEIEQAELVKQLEAQGLNVTITRRRYAHDEIMAQSNACMGDFVTLRHSSGFVRLSVVGTTQPDGITQSASLNKGRVDWLIAELQRARSNMK